MRKWILLTLVCLLAACSQTSEPPTELPQELPPELPTEMTAAVEAEPSDKDVAALDSSPETMTPIPSTPISAPPTSSLQRPTSIALPEGVLFREDFNRNLQDGWQWWNEDSERWSFVEYGDSIWLQIVGDDPPGPHSQVNSLVRPMPEGDFVITAHVIAEPRVNFQQANIFIFENEASYIRLNLGFCDRCGLLDGNGFFLENIVEGNAENTPPGVFSMHHRDAEVQDVYLRLVRQGRSVTGYYATEYGDWQLLGSYNHIFSSGSIGLGTTNIFNEGQVGEDIVAMFEFFEVSVP